MCNDLSFDYSTIINMTIGAAIGFYLSYLAACFYDRITNKRKQKELSDKYKPLESRDSKFDWQHWTVKNGKIADTPIDSFMRTKYDYDKTFSFEWIESVDGKIEGNGKIFFEDETYGKLNFFSINYIHYDRRDIFYKKEINHKDKSYEAIFVNAKDQNYDYVLLILNNAST